ncbi:MAG: ribosome biogenesis GTP-binding protein YihA/YsxC [Chromatiales bacterium]|nr:ribosome biogenesis GTP-binding protein YihA/YsxC [Chromatiales bacterium]
MHRTSFQLSAAERRGLPPDRGAEIAFAGRSNSGKSSALNAITGRRGLARVSKTPGRTRLINFFTIDDHHALVDLPGYGYAKVSHETRAGWEELLGDYLHTRRSLRGVVVTMDCRHPLTPLDETLLDFCTGTGRPVHVLLTKADKLAHHAQLTTLREVRKRLAALSSDFSVQLFSAQTGQGVEEAQGCLATWLELPLTAGPDEGKRRQKKPRKQGERNRGR